MAALSKVDLAAGGAAFENYANSINELIRGTFEGGGGGGRGGGVGRLSTSDVLTRIGLFKGGADSQAQTLRANLAAVQAIQGNTSGLIPAITNA